MSDEIDINLTNLARESGSAMSGDSLAKFIQGKNWLGGSPKTPKNDDNLGLVFITRPDFNLTYDNIGVNRPLAPLLTNDKLTLPFAVKALLCPHGQTFNNMDTPLVNSKYPFMTILDNSLTELSGWPDYVMEEQVTQAGKYGQQLSAPKGTLQNFSKFNLSMTHQNVKGDMVGLVYHTWLHYMHNVRTKGTMASWPFNIAKRRKDWESRIYRIILNNTGTHVTQFTMTSAGFPMTYPGGSIFNMSTQTPVNDGYDSYNVQWSAMHCWHNDPLVIREFNRTVIAFNSTMRDSTRSGQYAQIPHGFEPYFEGVGYPRIDPLTLEFQIWVEKDIYTQIINSLPDDLVDGVKDIDEDGLTLRERIKAFVNDVKDKRTSFWN